LSNSLGTKFEVCLLHIQVSSFESHVDPRTVRTCRQPHLSVMLYQYSITFCILGPLDSKVFGSVHSSPSPKQARSSSFLSLALCLFPFFWVIEAVFGVGLIFVRQITWFVVAVCFFFLNKKFETLRAWCVKVKTFCLVDEKTCQN